MTSQMNTKLRFVRCPRCHQVLPELAELTLYKCGGCDTTLQAKKQKNDTTDTGSHLHETDPTQENELDHVSEDNRASSSNEQATFPSTGESAPDKISERDQNALGDCNQEQPGGRNFSNELPSSTELTCHENAVSSPEDRAHMESDEGRCPSDQYNQNEFGDCNRERSEGMNFSDEVSSSTGLNQHENESSSPGAGAHKEVDESKNSLEWNNGRDHNGLGGCNGEWSGKIKISKEVPSSTELICHEIEEPSPVAGADTEVDDNFKSRFIFGSLGAENLLVTRPRDSIPLDERIVSDNLMSPYNEQLEQSQKSIHQGFDRVNSLDTLKNIPPVNPSSKLSVTQSDLSKSPTTRSYYAYDASVSSYDGTDDQVPDQHLHPSKRNFKDADFVSTKGPPRRDERMVCNMISESEMQQAAMNSSSIPPGNKHRAMKGKWRQDELPEPTRHGHPVRSRMRLEADENLSRLPFYSKGSQAGHRNGSPSSYGHNEFQYHLSFHLPDKPEHPELDKMQLLRMVYELQDQLSKTYVSNGKANGRFPPGAARKEKLIPSYCNHSAPEGGIYPDLKHPRYPGRCSRGKIWPQQCKISRMAFSGEATHGRCQVDCSCLHCCTQDWHCSAPLPPHVICCNKGQYAVHPSHDCYNPYHSCSSSPQHHIGSEISLLNRDTKSDDQRHKDLEVKKLYRRERHHSKKRHFRPIAGGAPIIACYRCSELLQVPADFLLFKRRCQRLRCSACSEVLKFSLQNKTHLVRYIPDASAPPPSEADDYRDATNGRNLASTSHANNCSHAEPVSCSDDYGQSFCKSCSTEGDPFSLTSSHTLERYPNNRKMSSGSSFEPMEERSESFLEESRNKYKNPVESFKSGRHLSKMYKREKFSSEIEELPRTAGSPLHQLMGYSTPSQGMNR